MVELRELGIPPHAFLRRDVHLVSCRAEMERVRGILSYIWTSIPGYTPREEVSTSLHLGSRMPGGGQYSFHEAIARILAWRQYHEC